MKRILVASMILASTIAMGSSDIYLSKGIKKDLREKIEKDLNALDQIQFKSETLAPTLKIMGLAELNSHTAVDWLNQRVNYVVSENALSLFNLLVRRVIFVEQENVDFPNANIAPYSLETMEQTKLQVQAGLNSEKAMTVMSNIGSALYLSGKNDHTVLGMKVSRGLFKRSERVALNSPRAGIIQIGEGLFSKELAVNRNDEQALANTVFRMGTFFHEARHSDGNGESLGFLHAICPKGHDYEGEAACDENLNGPYSVGMVMMAEMTRACEDKCSAKETETLKLLVLDSANRILKTTHKNEAARVWDATPESL
jgi:hypothetical protein